jgi:hypothetical protein
MDGDCVVEPGGRGDFHADGAEHVARGLLQDKADAPGRQQRVQRAGGKAVDDGEFQQAADNAGADEGDRHGDKNAERAGDDLQSHVGEVAA